MQKFHIFSITLLLLFFSFPVFAENTLTKPSDKKTVSDNEDNTQSEKQKNVDPVAECFSKYTENEPIRFCLKVTYEKSERKRRFVQEKMFEILIEQNFMPEEERVKIDKLKLRRKTLKEKNSNAKNKEEAMRIAKERIFDAENERIILEFEQKNEVEREKALEIMKTSDFDFEKYRSSECERQKHFYSGNPDFSQFIYFSCLYKITEDRIRTFQESLK